VFDGRCCAATASIPQLRDIGASGDDEALAKGLGDEVRARTAPGLRHGVADVRANGVVGEVQLVGDLAPRAAVSEMSRTISRSRGVRVPPSGVSVRRK
jgi:adenosylmethionine-8-amino-7-oxononanoate aminotransferase